MPADPVTPIKPSAKPSLTSAEVSGGSGPNSPRARHQAEQYTLAQEALRTASADELFILYEAAIRERNQMSSALLTAVGSLIGKEDGPRLYQSDNAIAAMERVALAALELAKLTIQAK